MRATRIRYRAWARAAVAAQLAAAFGASTAHEFPSRPIQRHQAGDANGRRHQSRQRLGQHLPPGHQPPVAFDSGAGREKGIDAVNEYLQGKSVWINTGAPVFNYFAPR